MNHEKLAIAIYILVALIFIKRIFQWSRLDHADGERKGIMRINLIGAAIYSVLMLLPVLFENKSPQDRSFVYIGNGILIVYWVFIFSVHLFFLWFNAEVGMWLYKSEKRKNHIQ